MTPCQQHAGPVGFRTAESLIWQICACHCVSCLTAKYERFLKAFFFFWRNGHSKHVKNPQGNLFFVFGVWFFFFGTLLPSQRIFCACFPELVSVCTGLQEKHVCVLYRTRTPAKLGGWLHLHAHRAMFVVFLLCIISASYHIDHMPHASGPGNMDKCPLQMHGGKGSMAHYEACHFPTSPMSRCLKISSIMTHRVTLSLLTWLLGLEESMQCNFTWQIGSQQIGFALTGALIPLRDAFKNAMEKR